MTNPVLLQSSMVCTFLHIITLINFPNVSPFYGFILTRGCLSSIYNHGSSNEFAKWYDRTVMRESFFVDLFFMLKTNTLDTAGTFMVLAAILYFFSKLIQHIYKQVDPFTDFLHLMAHIGITIAHIIVIIAH